MTDMESISAILSRAGVKFTVEAVMDSRGEDDPAPFYRVEIPAKDGDSGPNRGYIGFYADMIFSSEGALQSVGAWE